MHYELVVDWGQSYTNLVGRCLTGVTVNPRGRPNKEVRPVLIESSKHQQLRGAGVSYKFATAEAMAVVCGWDDVAWLERFNPRIKEFSDNGKTFYGSYGGRLVLEGDQLQLAVKELKRDPVSRRVVLTIYYPQDLIRVGLGEYSKDHPCNTTCFLKVRGGALDLTVFRRSADVVWGVPYDHHVFWFLLKTVADALNVKEGRLREYVDSLHVYLPEAKFYEADRVLKACGARSRRVPDHWPVTKDLTQTRTVLEHVREALEEDFSLDHPLYRYLKGR